MEAKEERFWKWFKKAKNYNIGNRFTFRHNKQTWSVDLFYS